MKRWKIIGLVVIGLVAVAVIVAVAWPSDEPSWHGAKLTTWLERGWASQFLSVENPSDEPARAVREIGTNGLPTLIKLLGARDGPLKSRLIDLANGQKLFRVHFRTDLKKVMLGEWGLSVLGSNAFPAFSQLMKLWQHGRGQTGPTIAASLLSTVAPKTNAFFHALEDCFAASDVEIKRGAAELLQLNFPQDAERLGAFKAFPDLLIRVTNRPVVEVREVVK